MRAGRPGAIFQQGWLRNILGGRWFRYRGRGASGLFLRGGYLRLRVWKVIIIVMVFLRPTTPFHDNGVDRRFLLSLINQQKSLESLLKMINRGVDPF